jgi:HAD superfamily hydrolase (TIGR01490 family)
MNHDIKKEKLAVFDFCGTIANFQTFDPYLLFVLGKAKRRRPVIEKRIVRSIIEYIDRVIHIFDNDFYLHKYLLVWMTRGISEEELVEFGKQYYDECIKPNLISETISLIKQFQKEGYYMIIASAGSKYYIKHFADDYGFDKCITAEIGMINGQSTGRLITDCMGERKAFLLRNYAKELEEMIEIIVSDSISDLPIFRMGKRKIVISKEKHQYWVDNSMEEILCH